MRPAVSRVIGVVEGVLLARLIGLLFAARPDNPVFETVFELSTPLVWPWAWLDRLAGQPRSGARLELATLAMMATVAILSGLWSLYRARKARSREEQHG